MNENFNLEDGKRKERSLFIWTKYHKIIIINTLREIEWKNEIQVSSTRNNPK